MPMSCMTAPESMRAFAVIDARVVEIKVTGILNSLGESIDLTTRTGKEGTDTGTGFLSKNPCDMLSLLHHRRLLRSWLL